MPISSFFRQIASLLNKKNKITESTSSIAVSGNVSNSSLNVILKSSSHNSSPESIPLAHRAKIIRFVDYYMGTKTTPVPFGGRAQQLKDLTTWLDSPDSSSQLFVYGPAGRGKTALLVRWMAGLEKDRNVIFFPISRRFQTNSPATFYECIASQLSGIIGVELTSTYLDAVEFYKEKCFEFFQSAEEQKIKILLCIDGLDEIDGWEIDTSLLGLATSNHRIIVSARTLAGDIDVRGWLGRLEWGESDITTKVVCVPKLTRGDLKLILKSTLPDNIQPIETVIDHFYKISNGDPLLARLLLEDFLIQLSELNENSLSFKDFIYGVDIGYNGYFHSWVKNQISHLNSDSVEWLKTVNSLLAILTASLGPLKLRDLEEIMEDSSFNCELSLVPSVLQLSMQRLILGDGNIIGYSFQHPKFAGYFRNEYFKEGLFLQNAEKAILNWIDKSTSQLSNNSSFAPSSYIMNYFAQHIATGTVSQRRIEAIASYNWFNAWLIHDGGISRFSTDVKAVSKLCSGLKLPDTAMLCIRLRCALSLSSVVSIGTNTPLQLLLKLSEAGKITFRQIISTKSVRGGHQLLEAIAAVYPVCDNNFREELLARLAEQPTGAFRSECILKISESAEKDLCTDLLEWAHSEMLTFAHVRSFSDDMAPHLTKFSDDQLIKILNSIKAKGINFENCKNFVIIGNAIDDKNNLPNFDDEVMSAILEIEFDRDSHNLYQISHLTEIFYHSNLHIQNFIVSNLLECNDTHLKTCIINAATRLKNDELLKCLCSLIDTLPEFSRILCQLNSAHTSPQPFQNNLLDVIHESSISSLRVIGSACIPGANDRDDWEVIVQQAASCALELKHNNQNIALLEFLLRCLPKSNQTLFLRSLIDQNHWFLTNCVLGLEGEITEEQAALLLDYVKSCQDSTQNLHILKGICNSLNLAKIPEMLSIIERLNIKEDFGLFEKVAKNLSNDHLDTALSIFESINDYMEQVELYCMLAELGSDCQEPMAAIAVSLANRLHGGWEIGNFIRKATFASDGVLVEKLAEHSLRITNDYQRIIALFELIEKVQPNKNHVVKALILQEYKSNRHVFSASQLAKMASLQSDIDIIEDIFELMKRQIRNCDKREVVESVSSNLPGGHVPIILQLCDEIGCICERLISQVLAYRNSGCSVPEELLNECEVVFKSGNEYDYDARSTLLREMILSGFFDSTEMLYEFCEKEKNINIAYFVSFGLQNNLLDINEEIQITAIKTLVEESNKPNLSTFIYLADGLEFKSYSKYYKKILEKFDKSDFYFPFTRIKPRELDQDSLFINAIPEEEFTNFLALIHKLYNVNQTRVGCLRFIAEEANKDRSLILKNHIFDYFADLDRPSALGLVRLIMRSLYETNAQAVDQIEPTISDICRNWK